MPPMPRRSSLPQPQQAQAVADRRNAFAGLLDVKQEFAQFFGGTSLLILVGVVLDTLQHIESHLLMRHYDGLLDSGRIRGAH